jgi:hypothetical protein
MTVRLFLFLVAACLYDEGVFRVSMIIKFFKNIFFDE